MVCLKIMGDPLRGGRNLMGFVFTGEAIGMFIKSGSRTIQVASELPADAEFLTAHFSYERNAFVLVFEHPAFPFVKEGSIIPWTALEIRIDLLEPI